MVILAIYTGLFKLLNPAISCENLGDDYSDTTGYTKWLRHFAYPRNVIGNLSTDIYIEKGADFMNNNNNVIRYFDSAPEQMKIILYEIRTLIHQTIAKSDENIKWGFAVFGNPNDYSYLRFNKKHITFGFYNFQRILSDSEKLEGTGNSMRHIKIVTKKDIDKELFSKWLKEITAQ